MPGTAGHQPGLRHTLRPIPSLSRGKTCRVSIVVLTLRHLSFLFRFCASLADHLGSSRQGIALVRKDSFSMQIRRFLKKVVMFSESCGPPLPGPRVHSQGCFRAALSWGRCSPAPPLSSAALGARPGPAPTWELPRPWPSVLSPERCNKVPHTGWLIKEQK